MEKRNSDSAVGGISTSGNSGSKVSMDKIRELEAMVSGEATDTPVRSKTSTLDMYKDSDGNLTYFYKNISSTDIIFSNPKMKEFIKGTSINLTQIFDTVDEMVNFRDLSKLLQPLGDDQAMVRRLTPDEYYEELSKKATVEQKRRAELISRNKGASPKSTHDSVSDVVQTQVSHLNNYLNMSEEKRQETKYTVYDFISWINSYNFNRAEYDLMLYSIKDSEVLHAIQQRKSQLIRYGLYAEVSPD